MTGDELKEKCQQLGITQQALAEQANYCIAWIQDNWRRGERQITPRLEEKLPAIFKEAKK